MAFWLSLENPNPTLLKESNASIIYSVKVYFFLFEYYILSLNSLFTYFGLH